MTPTKASRSVLSDRLGWVGRMLTVLRGLPLDERAKFMADSRNMDR